MASRFRVDHDSEGNAEVSAARPRKLRPLESEELAQPGATGQPAAPPTPLKSAMKKGSGSMGNKSSADSVEAEPPGGARRAPQKKQPSALDPRPPPSAEKPAQPSPRKSALKSALRDQPPPPPKTPPKSALKTSARSSSLLGGASGERCSPLDAGGGGEAVKPTSSRGGGRAGGGRSASRTSDGDSSPSAPMVQRPSLLKMNLSIEDPNRWTNRALCKHYFHYAAQKMLWAETVASSGPMTQRKSIRIADMENLAKQLGDMAASQSGGAPARRLGTSRASSFASEGGEERRRQSIKSQHIILEDDDNPSTPQSARGGRRPVCAISPLKEVLLAKRPDLSVLIGLLQDMSPNERKRWLNCTLDATPPPMPAPLFHAVAAAQWDVVATLVEFKVDVTAEYEGKSLLKGWIRPKTPLVECIRSRKGRFVGTMLGDKLEAVEVLLTNAASNRKATSQAKPAEEEDFKIPYKRPRAKSVQLRSSRGLMLHTQGHPNSKYELDGIFGGSSGSTTIAAISSEDRRAYAIKAGSKLVDSGRKDPEAELWNEIVTMRKLDHPNIIRLIETFEDETHIFMVFELCKGGELFDHLVRDGSLAENVAMRLAFQMASAIRHLHQLRICHRDIRPEAFYVAEGAPLANATLKMMDLSSAKDIGGGTLTTKICTLHYVAPEVLTSIDGYTEKVDVWSFGVVLYVMAAGIPPFDADDELEVLQAVKEGELVFEPEHVWDGVSQATKDLVSSLLTRDPDERPDIVGAMELPRLALAERERDSDCPAEPGPTPSASSSVENASQLRNAFETLGGAISDSQLLSLKKLFREQDPGHTGAVNIGECRQGLLELLQGTEGVDSLLKQLDDGDFAASINYTMILATMTDKRRALRREAARSVFNMFDIDKNGNVSVYEIAQAMSKETELREGKLGNIPQRELQAIWDEMHQVFAGQEFSDRELTFEDFFKQLPRTNLDALV